MKRYLFYFISLVLYQKVYSITYDHSRNSIVKILLSPSDFASKNGKYENGQWLLQAREEIIPLPSGESGITDRHRWGVWHALKDCHCNGLAWGYCCPVIEPDRADHFIYGPYIDLSGKGELSVYIDVELVFNFDPIHVISGSSPKTNKSKELGIVDKFITFDIIGDGIEQAVKLVGLKHFKDNLFQSNPEEVFMKTKGNDPKRVEFRIFVSSDLVKARFKSAIFIWNTERT